MTATDPDLDLLVRLPRLDGFEPAGLRTILTGIATTGIVVQRDVRPRKERHGEWEVAPIGEWSDMSPEDAAFMVRSCRADEMTVSAEDRATRDALARYIAKRVGLEVRATAPDWGPDRAWDVFGWTLGDNHSPRSVMFMPPEMIERRPNWIRNRRIPVPGLPDPNDMNWSDRLADGVIRMHALALVHTAVYVGRMDWKDRRAA